MFLLSFCAHTARTLISNSLLLQMYTLSKATVPMDVEFMLSDTFELLRPKLVLFKTFSEAAQAVEEMMAAVAKNGPGVGEEEVEEAEEEGRKGALELEEEAGEDGEESSDSEDSEVSRCSRGRSRRPGK